MRFILPIIATSTLLAACGGGSDSATTTDSSTLGATQSTSTTVGSSSTPGVTPAPGAISAVLTLANYVTVAQEALSSSTRITTITDFAAGAQISDASPVAVGVVSTETDICDKGGSITFSENDANNNLIYDAGDSGSITATKCLYDGFSLDGELLITLVSVTGDITSFPFTTTANLQMKNFSPLVGSVGNGALVMSIDARDLFNYSVEANAPSLEFSTMYGDVTYKKTLTNYSISSTKSSNSATFTTSASGMLSSSAFDSKSVEITTPTPFVRFGAQAYPSSGQLLITGAAGSKVRLSATSATQIRIELDADANGIYETSTTKLWSEML